jgi:hypothetical protein
MKKRMKTIKYLLSRGALALGAAQLIGAAHASSHMDAPLITLDPAANTTDVYAFVTAHDGQEYLTVALGVYPFEEPGIGPNKYNFDDNVLYEINLALGDHYKTGTTDLSYQFQFTTHYKDTNTILQSYLGVVENVGDANQNLTQTYSVTKVDFRGHTARPVTVLGHGIVPPNNQGIATPHYNQGEDGENPAKDGVATAAELDQYTSEAITNLADGYRAFAGQRDDGFYGDIQAVFDLLQLRNPGQDAQAGFNIHLMELEIPISELGGTQQIAGVYATTSRRQITVLRSGSAGFGGSAPQTAGPWVQVARQGNPLFNEGLVAIADKDLYSRTSPTQDSTLFRKYALTPELAHLLNVIVFNSSLAPETNRTDIVGIFIPDLLKVDLSTGPCLLGGNGTQSGNDPDDPGFSRLGIFGGDTLTSTIQAGFGNGTVPGGWPNGRRFGDDVIDIAVTALISDLRVSPPIINGPAGDNVNWNDVAYNKVFPYESTPHNGRNHQHAQ